MGSKLTFENIYNGVTLCLQKPYGWHIDILCINMV